MGVMRYHCSRGWRFPRRDQPPFRKQAQIKSEANPRAPLVGQRMAWGLAHGDGAINGRYQVVTESGREILSTCGDNDQRPKMRRCALI